MTLKLNQIDKHTQHLVYGFLRNNNGPLCNIPDLIIYQCLLYYYPKGDYFDYGGLNTTIQSITEYKDLVTSNYGDGSCYGKIIVPSITNDIYKWTFKITNLTGYIGIGIDKHQRQWINSPFFEKEVQSYAYCSDGSKSYWRISSKSPSQSYSTGDIISMILNLSTASLTFVKNGKRLIPFNNIPKDNNIKYKMCVYVGIYDDGVQLISYNDKNTKRCPKCHKMHSHLYKQETNVLICSKSTGGCGYEFCWECKLDWKKHGYNTGGNYQCIQSNYYNR